MSPDEIDDILRCDREYKKGYKKEDIESLFSTTMDMQERKAFLADAMGHMLHDILQAEEVTPSLSQAQRLKRASQEGRLSEQDIAAIMREEKAQTRDTGKVTLPAKEIEQFFPKSYTPAQKKKVIVKLLASWARQRGEQVR